MDQRRQLVRADVSHSEILGSAEFEQATSSHLVDDEAAELQQRKEVVGPQVDVRAAGRFVGLAEGRVRDHARDRRTAVTEILGRVPETCKLPVEDGHDPSALDQQIVKPDVAVQYRLAGDDAVHVRVQPGERHLERRTLRVCELAPVAPQQLDLRP